MHLDQLRALLAVVDHGTFDAAARSLHVTPSAVSQRIKGLERDAGRVLVERALPCRATEAGETLVRAARQMVVLEHDAREALGGVAGEGGAPRLRLPVAVNADSLATWFVEVLETVGEWGDARLRVFVEDQDHSAQLLRDGSVIGAVTASDVVVQGCSVQELGVMRYVARVRRSQWEACGRSLERVPTVRFNDRDDLQRGLLRRRGLGEPPLEHVVPSAEGFSAAVRAGLGWGMIPEGLEGPAGRGGGRDELIAVPGVEPLDVPLYWQCWRLDAPSLARLSDEVTSAAHALR